MKRFAQCPVCNHGGIIDLHVLGMCLFCWFKRNRKERT